MKRILILLTGVFFSLSIFGQTQDLKITHLTTDYYIFTTYHSYKGQRTSANGLYVVTKKGIIMIDTPWDTTQCQPLLDSIEVKHKKKVVMCIATHSHEDRTGGLEFLNRKGVKTYTTFKTDEICVAHGEKRAKYHFVSDTTFSIGQYSFHAFWPGEGHTKDNIVVWFPKAGILYGGCLIKSTEAEDLGYIKEANLETWPGSLNNLRKECVGAKYVIPGHEEWKNANSIEHTLALLKQNKK